MSDPNVRAVFSGGNGKYNVSITIVGDPNVFVDKVNDEYIARFPNEWAAFSKGEKEPEVIGTKLGEIGLTTELARHYQLKGVRNIEDLAALSDMGCSALGMGAITNRKNAINYLKVKQMEAAQIVQEAAKEIVEKRGPGRPKKEVEAA
jgi:hypothetical protein